MTIPEDIYKLLHEGTVIPALPLALNARRKLDDKRQRALIRYYLDAGSGGLATGVHTTQFAIRNPEINIYEPLLKLAREEIDSFSVKNNRAVIKIAGVIGRTDQAQKEAELALKYGYHAVLLSLAAFKNDTNKTITAHCRKIARIIPLFGFYLQPAVGGRKLDKEFWKEFAGIENVVAIKIAPFNRYQTLDVVRGVVESGRAREIALYTGNDDNILTDLLTEYKIVHEGKTISKRIVGGLLGHWAVWTHTAVKLLNDVKKGVFDKDVKKALVLANQITDCNAAFFDTANDFRGCIAGLHEVLKRQGFFKGIWTLDPNEKLSPGQKQEIDRIYSTYQHLNDDAFVAANIHKWFD